MSELPLPKRLRDHLPTIVFDIDRKKTDSLIASGPKVRDATSGGNQRSRHHHDLCPNPGVTKAQDPDLGPVMGSAKTVGQNLKKGAIVVLELTVHPGVTEDVAIAILEQESGMACEKDFLLATPGAYQPE